jgi:hypothetical protein
MEDKVIETPNSQHGMFIISACSETDLTIVFRLTDAYQSTIPI